MRQSLIPAILISLVAPYAWAADVDMSHKEEESCAVTAPATVTLTTTNGDTNVDFDFDCNLEFNMTTDRDDLVLQEAVEFDATDFTDTIEITGFESASFIVGGLQIATTGGTAGSGDNGTYKAQKIDDLGAAVTTSTNGMELVGGTYLGEISVTLTFDDI